MSSLYRQAIKSLVPKGTEFENIVDREGGKITKWKSPEVPQPSNEAIQAKLAELQAEYDSKQYQRDRLKEYPNTNDLLVALWEKVVEGRSESADALEVKRQEVKTAHPKPE